jgi:hypothetical protein
VRKYGLESAHQFRQEQLNNLRICRICKDKKNIWPKSPANFEPGAENPVNRAV